MNKGSFLLFLLFSFSLAIPAENEFTLIKSYENTKFQLRNELKEAYFKFQNSFTDGDIGISFALGNGFTVEVYVYTSYDKIKVDETGYINSDWKFKLNNIKEFTINNSEIQITGNYYIVIKDTKNYYYQDYIKIFNEKDEINLQPNSPYQITQFYSTREFSFVFEGTEKEIIDINLINKDPSNTHSVKLYKYGSAEPMQEYTDSNIVFGINRDQTTAGKYLLKVTSTLEGNSSLEEIKNILMYKTVNYLNTLQPEKITSLSVINQQTFNFYANINDYKENEENIITYYLDYEMTGNIYCKVAIAEETDQAISAVFPKGIEENECIIEKAGDSDTYKHMYFRKTKSAEGNKKVFIMVVADLKEPAKFIQPKKFNIGISRKVNYIQLSQIKDFYSDSEDLVNYIPRLYKIELPTTSTLDKSYIIFSESRRIMTIYKGNMITGDKINENKFDVRTYVFNKDNIDANTKYITVQFFGSIQKGALYIQSTPNKVYYFQGARPNKSFTFDMKNCNSPVHFVGFYDAEVTSIMFYEEQFGKFEVYHKTDILSLPKSIVPTKSDTLVSQTDQYLILDNEMDLLTVSCVSPGRIDVHFMGVNSPTEFKYDMKYDFILTQGNDFPVKLPEISETVKKIYIEVSSPLKREIKYSLGGEEFTLMDPDYSKKHEYTQNQDSLSFTPTVDAIARVIVSKSNDLFTKITGSTQSAITSPNVFIQLLDPNKTDYINMEVKLTGIKNDFYYSLSHFNSDDRTYVIPPQNTDIDGTLVKASTLVDNTYTFSINNPQDKHNANQNYFLVVSFVETLFNEISPYNIVIDYIDKKETYQIIDVMNYQYLPTSSDTKNKLELTKNNHPDVVFTAVRCLAKDTEFSVTYFDTVFEKVELKDKYTVGVFSNRYIQTQIMGDSPKEGDKYFGIGFSYYFKAKDDESLNATEITQFNNNEKLNIEYTEATKTLTWNSFPKAKKYYLYILKSTDESKEYITNDCYLTSKGKKTNEGEDYQVIELDTNTYNFVKEGIFEINVVADFKEPLEFRVAYNGIHVEQKSEPVTPDTPQNLLWLWIVLSVIVGLILIGFIFYYCRKRNRTTILPIENSPLVGASGEREINY